MSDPVFGNFDTLFQVIQAQSLRLGSPTHVVASPDEQFRQRLQDLARGGAEADVVKLEYAFLQLLRCPTLWTEDLRDPEAFLAEHTRITQLTNETDRITCKNDYCTYLDNLLLSLTVVLYKELDKRYMVRDASSSSFGTDSSTSLRMHFG